MKYFLLLLMAARLSFAAAQQPSVLEGNVSDDTGDVLIGAWVKVWLGSTVVRGAITSLDGHYNIALEPGMYDVEVSYTGCTPSRTNGVQVQPNKINFLDIVLASGAKVETLTLNAYITPLIQQNVPSCRHLSPELIRFLPIRQIKSVFPSEGIKNPFNLRPFNSLCMPPGRITIESSRLPGIVRTIPSKDIDKILIHPGGLSAEFGTPYDIETPEDSRLNLNRRVYQQE